MAEWLRVTVRSPSDELNGLLAEGLLACGGSAVEERDGALVAYLDAARFTDARGELDFDAAATRVRAALRPAFGAEPVQLLLERVPEQDWLAIWRSGLAPRRVGARIVVAPTWSDVTAAADDIVIRIDPQMAFGTGEHASTRGVLRLMQEVVRPSTRLLDVGTGSAILAIAAARLGAAHVLAVEADADAIPNALENVTRNGTEQAVVVRHGTVDAAFLDAADPFDGILANVLSSVLVPLLPAFHRALRPRGWCILSGILAEESEAVCAAAARAGFGVEAEDVEAPWWSVLLRRA